MKYEFTYNFTVDYTVSDISEILHISPEEMEDMSQSELMDIFAEQTYGSDTGDIEVGDEYLYEPEYLEEDDELFARFAGTYTVITEGESYDECRNKANDCFFAVNSGHYNVLTELDGFEVDMKHKEVTKVKEKTDIERN